MFKVSECKESLFNTCNGCHRSTVSIASPIRQTVDKIYKIEMKGLTFLACSDWIMSSGDFSGYERGYLVGIRI